MIFDKILLNNLKKERKRGLNEVVVILVILYLIFFFYCQIHNIFSIKLNIKSINRDDLYKKISEIWIIAFHFYKKARMQESRNDFSKKKKKKKNKKKRTKEKNYKKSFHVIQNYLQYSFKIMAKPFCRISIFSRPLQHGNKRMMINFICLFCMEFRINEGLKNYSNYGFLFLKSNISNSKFLNS